MITTKDALIVNETQKIVTCPDNHQQLHIISKEEAEEEQCPPHKNTSPAADTFSQTATSMITQECIISISDLLVTPAPIQKNGKPDFTGDIINNNMGAVLDYRHLSKHFQYKQTWHHSYGNEIGRLAKGMQGQVKGTNTIFCIQTR